jgi:hypothetical protein
VQQYTCHVTISDDTQSRNRLDLWAGKQVNHRDQSSVDLPIQKPLDGIPRRAMQQIDPGQTDTEEMHKR